MRPISQSDRPDGSGPLDEAVPGATAMAEDIRIGRADPVREPIYANELTDILDRVMFGRIRRQGHERDIVRHLEGFRQVPSRLRFTKKRSRGPPKSSRSRSGAVMANLLARLPLRINLSPSRATPFMSHWRRDAA